MTPYYQDDACTIYHGDCREIFDDVCADVLVTDPPYGISYATQLPGNHAAARPIVGDSDTELVRWLFTQIDDFRDAVVFGANNFPELLPHRGRWICWDKRLTEDADRMLGSAFELAWWNRTSGYDRMFRVLHGGAINDNGRSLTRVHPTEKPVRLLRHVLNLVGGNIVLDPFMGSGTTLRAAKDLGWLAVGIEVEERYCEIAAKRLAQEVLAL